MPLELIKQTNLHWAVFQEEKIVAECLTAEALADFILAEKRAEVLEKLKTFQPSLSWEEALFRSKRLNCCICKAVLDSFNPKWPLERQRCRVCLGG